MNKLSKAVRNKKGFTLVEIIVVLVIIAVMAAVAIPNMLGFVQEARGSGYMTEARVGLVAAQATVTRLVAGGTAITDATAQILDDDSFKNMTAELDGAFTDFELDGSTVTGLTYTIPSGGTTFVVTIKDGDTTVSIDDSSSSS